MCISLNEFEVVKDLLFILVSKYYTSLHYVTQISQIFISQHL